MQRLTLFAKGNLDVHDSLHSFTLAGQMAWNGINEIVRHRFPGTNVRVRHETLSGWDALLAADGKVPEELAQRNLPLGAFQARFQFSSALFETDCDAIVLSIQVEVTPYLVRHRHDGYLFVPHQNAGWSAEDKAWLLQAFEPVGRKDADESMEMLGRVVARIRQRTQAPILVYNVSAISPGDTIHCYQGIDDVLSTRTRRFNLALIELSRQIGISIIDVDTIVGRAGADRVKLDHIHLTADGHRLVAEEVVRVLEEYGCFITPAVG